MAYETMYELPFKGPELSGIIYLQKLDYSGGTTQLRLEANGIDLEVKFGGAFDPIVRQKLTFNYINQSADFFEDIDLFELEEKEFKVIMECTNLVETMILFEGWLNADTVEQKYLHKSTVRLTATNYVAKLKFHFDESLETLEERSLMNYLLEAINVTGKLDNLNVNVHLLPTGHAAYNSSTPFNKGALFTEVFWKNNVERYSAFEIIEEILKSLECYIYWWNEAWWIERYRDIWGATKYAFRYQIDGDYSYGTGVAQHEYSTPIGEIKDLVWINRRQTLFMIPGYNTLEVLFDQKYFLNLTINDFTDAEKTVGEVFPDPDKRRWIIAQVSGSLVTEENLYQGQPTQFLSNAIQRNLNQGGFANFNEFDDWEPWYGTATKFSITNDGVDTVLNLKWINILPDRYFTWMGGDPDPAPIPYWTVQNCWYLRIAGTNKYIHFDGAVWTVETGFPWDQYNILEHNLAATQDEGNEIFNVQNQVSVPLSDIDDPALDGDLVLIFCIGKPICYNHEWGSSYIWPTNQFYREQFGDVLISVVNVPQDNLIRGKLENDVLESFRVETLLFDSENLNYKNAVLTNTDYDERTETWKESDDSGAEEYTLAEWLLVSKFQLYNKNRKALKGTIKSNLFYRPFSQFTDGNDDNRPYLLTSYNWSPMRGEYRLEMNEYDNTTPINLI